MNPWEIHPALVHFPIALLIAAFVLDCAAWIRRKEFMVRAAVWLYAAGVISAGAAAVAGVVAWRTAPMQSAAASLMSLHPILAGVTSILFLGIAVTRWNQRPMPASPGLLALSALAVACLIATAAVGGHLVSQHGVGVQPVDHHEVRPIHTDNVPPVVPGGL